MKKTEFNSVFLCLEFIDKGSDILSIKVIFLVDLHLLN